jgi:5-methylcytosine-specific restriction endonuclease McrA
MPPFKDLTGQRFSRLTVLRRLPNYKKSVVWECSCECGVIVSVLSGSLVTGNTKSCGCLQKETTSRTFRKDVTGLRVGYLTAIEPTNVVKKGSVVWKCQCDCGNIKLVKLADLRRRHVRSCGCSTKDFLRETHKIHGLSKTKEYKKVHKRNNNERRRLLDSAWTLEMELKLKNFQAACIICGETENLHIDHVRPLAKGFPLVPGNAVVLCGSCNHTKSDKSLDRLPEPIASLLLEEALHFKAFWELQQKENFR